MANITLSQQFNDIEKDLMSMFMKFMPVGTFSNMADFGQAMDEEVIDGLKTRDVVAVITKTLALCENMVETLDEIPAISQQLDELVEQNKRWSKVILGAVKNLGNEVDTRLDGIEYRMRSEEDLQAMLDRLRKENESKDSEKEE